MAGNYFLYSLSDLRPFLTVQGHYVTINLKFIFVHKALKLTGGCVLLYNCYFKIKSVCI